MKMYVCKILPPSGKEGEIWRCTYWMYNLITYNIWTYNVWIYKYWTYNDWTYNVWTCKVGTYNLWTYKNTECRTYECITFWMCKTIFRRILVTCSLYLEINIKKMQQLYFHSNYPSYGKNELFQLMIGDVLWEIFRFLSFHFLCIFYIIEFWIFFK
jgi:hypothetical protein